MRYTLIALLLSVSALMLADYSPSTYTSSFASTDCPSMATAPCRVLDGDVEPNPPDDPGGDNMYSENDVEPGNWADPSPLGSPWPLLLFAVAYAAYGAVRLRCRKLSANE